MNRPSIILHLDSLDVLDKLSDQECAELFRAIRDYNRGEELELSNLVDIVFTQFKNQFDRDIEKYQKICERNKNNGLKGGRPKTQKTQSVNLETQKNPENLKNKNKSNNNNKSNNILNIQKYIDKGYQQKRIDELVSHRKALKKPLLTDRMLSGLLKSLDRYADHWNITFDDACKYYLSQSWISIDVEYKYPARLVKQQQEELSYADISKRLREEKQCINEKKRLI